MIRSLSHLFQMLEQFPCGSQSAANGAELPDRQQLTGIGNGDNLRQVLDSGEVRRLSHEPRRRGLIQKLLALLRGPADGQAGAVGGGGAHGGGGERRHLLAHGAPFQRLQRLRFQRVQLGRVGQRQAEPPLWPRRFLRADEEFAAAAAAANGAAAELHR